MTETIHYCVNGCTRINADDQRIPARAVTGNLCDSCLDRLDRFLTEIPERYALLPDYLLPSADLNLNPDKVSGTRPAAPVPVRLAALDLLDERLGRKWLGTAAADERRGTIGTLLAIANELRSIRGSDPVTGSYVVTEADYIRQGIDTLAASTGIADTYAELKTLHRDLGNAVGQYPPRPVGACYLIDDETPHDNATCTCPCGHGTQPPSADMDPNDLEDHDCTETWRQENACDGPLLPITSGVVCVSCGNKWGHDDLRRLGAVLKETA